MIEIQIPKRWTELKTKWVVLNEESLEIIRLLQIYFASQNLPTNVSKKVYWWLTTKNPFFGHVTPLHMIQIARGHKVLKFIKDAQEGNLP